MNTLERWLPGVVSVPCAFVSYISVLWRLFGRSTGELPALCMETVGGAVALAARGE
jgi:hypothetical protein